jgi:trehalose 6-phosphate phosphatase
MSETKKTREPIEQNVPWSFSPSSFRVLDPKRLNNSISFQSLNELAFFLDLDGTLLDLANKPDDVKAETGLQESLELLFERTAGAVAIVTGRSTAFVDGLFPGHAFSVAGLHGAELRYGFGTQSANERTGFISPLKSQLFKQAKQEARLAASGVSGVIFEDKGKAFALHYKNAPDKADIVYQIMLRAEAQAGNSHILQAGKFVYEIKPAGSNKATAVRCFMDAAPFKNRLPVAAGDDLTDEAMFEQVNEMGGVSIRVGAAVESAETNAALVIGTPTLFRRWLTSLLT